MNAPQGHAPQPPADLHRRHPQEEILPVGTLLHRFYTTAFDPIYYDRGLDGRLNAPDGSYGVLYTAKAQQGAFAESFLRAPGRTMLPADLIAAKAYVTLIVQDRDLRLARLAGPGLGRVGATAQVVHGGFPYDIPQAWSAALHAHPAAFDGIAYYARHDDEALCYAIFDRARGHIIEHHREPDLDNDWFWDIAEPYGVVMAPTGLLR